MKKSNAWIGCLILVSLWGYARNQDPSPSLKMVAFERIDEIVFGPGGMNVVVDPSPGLGFLVVKVETLKAGSFTDENLRLFDPDGHEYRFVSIDPLSDSRWI